MKRMGLAWAAVLSLSISPSSHADSHVSGFVEGLYSQRVKGERACSSVEACPELANEQRLRVLAEGSKGPLAGTLRMDLWNDMALHSTKIEVNEAYADIAAGQPLSLRAGRQVVTWGTGEYLFVNDIFPKNFDRFFRGHSFDSLKDAVDGIKGSWGGDAGDLELIISRPQPDRMPSGKRYQGASMMPLEDIPRDEDGLDVAGRISVRLASFDLAGHAARYRSRLESVRMLPAGPRRETAPINHLGVSATGNMASGVVWAEVAQLQTDPLLGNVNRFVTGSRSKALLGYSRELWPDVTLTAQWQGERDTDRRDYLASLMPSVRPLARTRSLVHARFQARLMNQTVMLGVQGFRGNEGDSHVHLFAGYTPIDGLNLEAGANWFHGAADTQYGALSDDSNVYLSARYSY